MSLWSDSEINVDLKLIMTFNNWMSLNNEIKFEESWYHLLPIISFLFFFCLPNLFYFICYLRKINTEIFLCHIFWHFLFLFLFYQANRMKAIRLPINRLHSQNRMLVKRIITLHHNNHHMCVVCGDKISEKKQKIHIYLFTAAATRNITKIQKKVVFHS